jgi:hypothetical protein
MFARWKQFRKQAPELTLADLRRFPVWEFCLDEEGKPGQDESTVRPVRVREPIDGRVMDCLVATSFRTPEGKAFHGTVHPRAGHFESPWNYEPQILVDSPAELSAGDPRLGVWNPIVCEDEVGVGVNLSIPVNEVLSDADARGLIELVYSVLGVVRGGLFPMTVTPSVRISDWPETWRINGFMRPPVQGRESEVLT